ncbi:MAG: hypothetical protein IPM54_04805 [Polyangiaceae bacterium]|nr:hypothetical protein [Polyangiaceae bacterium]
MNRFAFALLFATSCAGSVTQDPPQDPGSMPDASTDAPEPEDAGTDAAALVVGQACTSDAECGGEYRCQLTAPGGYCSFFCSGDADCPTGSVCSPLPNSRVSGICMKSCSTTAECRPGYTCEIVHLFPGDPMAPSSPSPVCWEAQDAGP